MAGGIAIVTAIAAVASNRKFAFVIADIFGSWLFWFESVTSGAVLGGFAWILLKPRVRLTRAILVAITLNWTAWVVFLILTPALPESEFQQIAEARAKHDAGGGQNLMTEQSLNSSLPNTANQQVLIGLLRLVFARSAQAGGTGGGSRR